MGLFFKSVKSISIFVLVCSLFLNNASFIFFVDAADNDKTVLSEPAQFDVSEDTRNTMEMVKAIASQGDNNQNEKLPSDDGKISISQAFRLDENRNTTETITDAIKEKDNNWISASNNQYIRVVFDKTLTNQNDITLYAKPNGNKENRIEVYLPDSDTPLAVFPAINQEKFYKVFLFNLSESTDTFDLKITGDIDIDQIIDPDINYGSEYVFNSASTSYPYVSALDSTSFVVVYTDAGNSSYGTAIIGTISGTTISYGSEYVFNSASTSYPSVSALDSTSFVAAYMDAGNSSYGTAIIGTISGTTISYGSEYVFNSASTLYAGPFVSALDSTSFVMAYQDGGNSLYGTAIIGTVSGTTISYGSEYVFNSANTSNPSVSALDSTSFVVAYMDVGNSYYGTAIIGTVSGTTISYGSEYVFNPSEASYVSVSALDSTSFVVAYKDVGNSSYGTAIIGTVSGTTISYGSEYVFNSASTTRASVSALNSTIFVVAYTDAGNSSYGTAIIGTVSGTTISYGSEYVFNSASTSQAFISALDSTSFVVTYKDVGNSNYGAATIGTYISISDSTPPVPSNFSPASGTTIIDSTPTITFDTDETADCFASIDGDEAYDDMADDTDCTVGTDTSHSCTMGDLTPDGAKTIYVACQDVPGNKDTAGTNEELAYTLDTTPPAPSGFDPASASIIIDTTQTITFTTDENATCRLSLDGDETYAQMSDDTLCSGGGTTSQSCDTPALGSDGAKTVYIACTDDTNADSADTNEALSYTLSTSSSTSSGGGSATYWRRLYDDGLAPADFVEWWEGTTPSSSASSASSASSTSSASSSINPYRLLRSSAETTLPPPSFDGSTSAASSVSSRTQRICARVDRWIPLASPRRSIILKRIEKWMGIVCE